MYSPLAFGLVAALPYVSAQTIPAQAQVVDQRSFNVLEQVMPATEQNTTTVFIPPGITKSAATSKPFHIYNDAFYDIIGPNPSLTVIASSGVDPIFHEAVVWYEPTDEVFFVQNAGAKDAGTGLAKSAIIQKISLAQVAPLASQRNVSGQVDVITVPSNPQVINPNGGTKYQGNIVFTGEGQGNETAPSLYVMNPVEPYNTTVILNNYFGRQFNSLNDVSINPRNHEIYFTDTLYGFWQDFRPPPGLRNGVYRFNPATGFVSSVTDEVVSPNGLTFSPDGSYAYVTDTGAGRGFLDPVPTDPTTIYRFDVQDDGTWENKKVFAYASPGLPDGIHCDSKGNVYSGCGDGVQVWNESGVLLGKIFLGTTSANFNFAKGGRMVICAETELYYVQIAAEGNYVQGE